MKRVLSLIMVILFTACMLSACGKQAKEVTVEDVQEALINAGFSEAHPTKGYGTVYLDNTETCVVNTFPSIFKCNANTDIPKILDAVMPLYDEDFENGDGNVIVNMLVSDRRTYYDGDVISGDVIYKNYRYSEQLDDKNEFVTMLQIIHKG